MTNTPGSFEEHRLLAELGWVRSLALRLVRDGDAADDIAQQTYLNALERPPRHARRGPSLRAWLARVTRSVARTRARSEHRRSRREAEAARPERDERDLIEAVSVRRDVVAGVLELAEPYRSTLLRYHFEERSAAEIARLSGVADEVVRQRLVRGRALLRRRLESSYGEDGWRRALLLVIERDEPATPPRSLRRSPWPWLAAGCAGVFWLASVRDDPGAAVEVPDDYAFVPPGLVPPTPAAARREGLARWLTLPAPAPLESGTEATPARTASLLPSGGLGPEDELATRLSDDVGFAVFEPRPLEALERSLRRDTSEHSGHPRALVDGVAIYAALYEDGETGERKPCRVVRMPMAEGNTEERLVVVVADGRAQTAGLWGRREFDDDPDLRWVVFLQQLMSVQKQGAVLTLEQPSGAENRAWLQELEGQGTRESRLARAIVLQRVTMAGNAMARRGRELLESRGQRPPLDWYPRQAERMRLLARLSPDLEPVLGANGAATHASLAGSAAAAMEAYGEALARDSATGIADGQDRLGAACSVCHQTLGDDGEVPFFDAFEPFDRELDLRRGLAQVELGLHAAPGDDGVLSRKVAAAFRAALLLANEAP